MLERGEKDILPHMAEAIQKALGDALYSDRYVPDGKRYREAKAAVVTALKIAPELSLNGYPYYGFAESEFDGMRYMHESRAALFTNDSLAQIATALAWIDAIKVLSMPKIGSYGAKHRAERWGRENGFSTYVANGAVLVAAIYRKVPTKRVEDTPNALLGLDPDPVPEAKPGSFVAWLLAQTHTESPLGDLAREVKEDRFFPRITSSGPKLRSYLRSVRACPEAIETLDEALAMWRAERQVRH